MAKRGEPKHLKRIAVPKAVPITDKKHLTWMISPSAGPHSRRLSIPLLVLLRDILRVAKTAREARTILNSRSVMVDSVVRTDPAFPLGLFDIVSFQKADKYYHIMVDNKARLVPRETGKLNAKHLKVIGKYNLRKGKISLSLHDGRNMFSDNHIRVGDTVLLGLADKKIEKVLKLEKGAMCLITEGRHAGTVARLMDIIERRDGKPAEARLEGKNGEFITVARYLFVVDTSIAGAS